MKTEHARLYFGLSSPNAKATSAFVISRERKLKVHLKIKFFCTISYNRGFLGDLEYFARCACMRSVIFRTAQCVTFFQTLPLSQTFVSLPACLVPGRVLLFWLSIEEAALDFYRQRQLMHILHQRTLDVPTSYNAAPILE